MAPQEKRTFSLPTAVLKNIDDMVQSGTYATESEVVREGLRSLLEREEAVERWHEEISAVYDALEVEPGRIAPAKDRRRAGQKKIA